MAETEAGSGIQDSKPAAASGGSADHANTDYRPRPLDPDAHLYRAYGAVDPAVHCAA